MSTGDREHDREPATTTAPEAAFERFLRSVVPDLDEQVEGASPAEIASVEALAGHELPPFYRWFLATMGRSMGPLSMGIDLSIDAVLGSYRDDDDDDDLDEDSMRIGLVPEGDGPGDDAWLCYDLSRAARDDALVYCAGMVYGETLREVIARRAMAIVLRAFDRRCDGSFTDHGPAG